MGADLSSLFLNPFAWAPFSPVCGSKKVGLCAQMVARSFNSLPLSLCGKMARMNNEQAPHRP